MDTVTSASRTGRGYQENDLPPFTPLPWSSKEIRAAIPPHLFARHTATGLFYLARDIIMAMLSWSIALRIDQFFKIDSSVALLTTRGCEVARWLAWLVYWWFQGLIFTGIWVIGHECGHGAFSDHRLINDAIGFVSHTALCTPYFSWKISHHKHHRNHASMERDEVYVPKTRSDLAIPMENGQRIIYEEYFGDTPVYTLMMLVRQQLLAYPAYLLFHVSGQKRYLKWTNHFDPNSILFSKSQRNAVIVSDAGIALMAWAISWASFKFGFGAVVKLYGIPWLGVTHWFTMITYLHHTAPEIPHYRGKAWNFQRGAAATVDRNFLGWQGRFFLHDVAHYHVIHHFFPKMPFCDYIYRPTLSGLSEISEISSIDHGPEATVHLKSFLGHHYRFSDGPVFKVLWESYNKCQFVEDEGDVLFYRDKSGRAVRRPAVR